MSNGVLEINRERLGSFLPDIEQCFISDKAYAILDERWLVEEGYKAYKKWLALADLRNWRTNWDCDNLAASYRLFLQILHAKHNPYAFTERRNKKVENDTNVDSIAVGVIYYKNSSASYHAINLAICGSGFEFGRSGNVHTFKKVYIEPEHGVAIKLTKEEEDSICFVSF
jgi:hypothetical protein